MKYETPEMTVLTPAINAIQAGSHSKTPEVFSDSPYIPLEQVAAYMDWE
jgi:hypothetical protein